MLFNLKRAHLWIALCILFVFIASCSSGSPIGRNRPITASPYDLPYGCEDVLSINQMNALFGSGFILSSNFRGINKESLECIYAKGTSEKYTIEVEEKPLREVEDLYSEMPASIREKHQMGVFSFGFGVEPDYFLFLISDRFKGALISIGGTNKERIIKIAQSIDNNQVNSPSGDLINIIDCGIITDETIETSDATKCFQEAIKQCRPAKVIQKIPNGFELQGLIKTDSETLCVQIISSPTEPEFKDMNCYERGNDGFFQKADCSEEIREKYIQ